MFREAVVAGRFYPGSASALKRELAHYLDLSLEKQKALGVVVPHAGYVYSGAVAGKVYSAVQIPKTVLILGPNHTGLGASLALMASGVWNTPLGEVRINETLADLILKKSSDLKDDPHSHSMEHSIEVQLPFLQYLQPNLTFVPLSMYTSRADVCQRVGQAIASAVKDFQEEVLLVASTDMTHYESHESAQSKDQLAIEAIQNLDPEGLIETVKKHRISMCGVIPTATMLYACKELGASCAELIQYATSGEVSGDYKQVVGYAGLLIKA